MLKQSDVNKESIRNPTPPQQTVVKIWSKLATEMIQSLAPLLTLSISSQTAWNSNY
jgi:hypothetical protein